MGGHRALLCARGARVAPRGPSLPDVTAVSQQCRDMRNRPFSGRLYLALERRVVPQIVAKAAFPTESGAIFGID